MSTAAPISGKGLLPRWRIRTKGCHHWLRPAASARKASMISVGVAAMVALFAHVIPGHVASSRRATPLAAATLSTDSLVRRAYSPPFASGRS